MGSTYVVSQGSVNLDDFEFFALKKPVRTLADLINTGLFQGGTLDIFLEGKHLRIENVHLIVRGEEILGDRRYAQPALLHFRSGKWKRARNQHTFDFHTYGYGQPIALHDDKKKLMFVTLSHPRTPKSPPIQLVFYRTGRAPKPEDLQIITWEDGLGPVLGGKGMKSSRN